MKFIKTILFSFFISTTLQAGHLTIVIIGNDLPCLCTAYSICRDLEKEEGPCDAEIIVIGNCAQLFDFRLSEIREIFFDCDCYQRYNGFNNILTYTSRNELRYHNHFDFFFERGSFFINGFTQRPEEELEFLADPHLFNLRTESAVAVGSAINEGFDCNRFRRFACTYFQKWNPCRPHTIFCDRPIKEIVIADDHVCKGVLLNKGCFIRADLIILAHGCKCHNLLKACNVSVGDLLFSGADCDLLNQLDKVEFLGFNQLGISNLIVMPQCTNFCFESVKSIRQWTNLFFERSCCSVLDLNVNSEINRYPIEDLGGAPADYFSEEMNFPDSVDFSL